MQRLSNRQGHDEKQEQGEQQTAKQNAKDKSQKQGIRMKAMGYQRHLIKERRSKNSPFHKYSIKEFAIAYDNYSKKKYYE